MAQRRMFSLYVVDTDRFQSMPFSTQVLYYQLGMHADDDGFVDSPKRLVRSLRCGEKDLRLLREQGWIICFDSGIVAITDWKINNSIRADRYCETVHLREKKMLQVGPDKRYILVSDPEPDGCQRGDALETQYRLGKNRLEKNSINQKRIDNISIEKKNGGTAAQAPTPAEAAKESYGENGCIKLTDSQYIRLISELGAKELERCIAYIDTTVHASGTADGCKDWSKIIRQCHREGWGISKEQDEGGIKGL